VHREQLEEDLKRFGQCLPERHGLAQELRKSAQDSRAGSLRRHKDPSLPMLVEPDICLVKENMQALMMTADMLEPNPKKSAGRKQDQLKHSLAGQIRLNAYTSLEALINLRTWIHDAKEKQIDSGNKVNMQRHIVKTAILGEETRATTIQKGQLHGSHVWEKERTLALGVGALAIFIVLLTSSDRQPHNPTDVLANIYRGTPEPDHHYLDPDLANHLVEIHLTANAVSAASLGSGPMLQ
jgi:hypothetical protein